MIRGHAVLQLFLVLCVVFFVFSPALQQSFVHWDDDVHLYENPSLRGLDGGHLLQMFTSTVNKTYIPLTTFSFALEYHFVHLKPFIYHLDNILLHLAVVVSLYFLGVALGLSRRAALLGVLFFGIHPMHVESVVWVTQRKDVLYALFYILSCLNYVYFLKNQKNAHYFWSLFFAFLSILAKPMALSLPLVLCLLDWFVKGRFHYSMMMRKIPFFAVIVPIAWITYQMNMRAVDLNFIQAPLVWLWSLGFYLSKFFYPYEYLALYQLPLPVAWSNPALYINIGAVALFVTAIIYFRRHRLWMFAAAYFLLSIFFLLRFDNKQDLSFVADRFMYLPSAGFCFLIGSLTDRGLLYFPKARREPNRIILGIVCMAFFFLAVQSHDQVKLWGDEFRLWSKVVERYPIAAAYNHLGNYFFRQGNYAQALTYYDLCIKINPQYHKPYGNRGVVHLKEKNYDAAIADFTVALTLDPKDVVTSLNNRGYASAQLKNFDDALRDYNEAIRISPDYFTAYMNRATLFKDQGDLPRALEDLNKAYQINPQDFGVQTNIQWLKKRMKQ